ncbi:MAG: hypothetical protein ACMG57_01345 [Candidatus Dojkabacteria bacterium]
MNRLAAIAVLLTFSIFGVVSADDTQPSPNNPNIVATATIVYGDANKPDIWIGKTPMEMNFSLSKGTVPLQIVEVFSGKLNGSAYSISLTAQGDAVVNFNKEIIVPVMNLDNATQKISFDKDTITYEVVETTTRETTSYRKVTTYVFSGKIYTTTTGLYSSNDGINFIRVN